MQYGCRLSAGFRDNRAEADGSVRFRQEAGYDLMILLMMRSYFCIDLKGKSLFLPFWRRGRRLSAERCFSSVCGAVCVARTVAGLVVRGLCGVLPAVCCRDAGGLLFRPLLFVRATAGGMALSGERFEADYPPRRYAALCTKGILLGTVTLGVYLPWFIRDVVRYFAEGTSFRFHALEFRGSASALFSYAVLLCVAPAFVVYSLVPVVMMRASAGTEGMYVLCWFLYILLLAFVCVYRAVAVKWFVDFTYGGKRLLSTVCGWRAGCFVFGQALLVLVTLGLYYPMALLRVWRYYVGRLVLGREEVEDRFGFTMQPGRNYLFVLGQLLLTVVTFGLYFPWAYARVASLLVGRSYVEVQEERGREPMPECTL